MIGRSAANDALVIPAIARLYTQTTGQPAPAAPPSTEHQEMAMMTMAKGKTALQHNYLKIPGYDIAEETEAEVAARRDRQREEFRAEARRLAIPEDQWPQYFDVREKQEHHWLRASELASPAPRGHFLREFGQSDRELIENANYDASVPQALALMNGELLPQLTQRFSQLRITLDKIAAPEEKVRAAYLALLSRAPTEKEKALWASAAGRGLDSTDDLIFALINSQQFLFIQ
jgi:hypothetical protein